MCPSAKTFTKSLLTGLLALFAASAVHATLTLHPEASGPYDLRIDGKLKDLPAGESRWIRWDDLAALPHKKIPMQGEFLPGEQQVTVVYLQTVLDNLPLAPGADTVLAACTDGYLSIFQPEFIQKWQPILVLKINDLKPESWPPPGLDYNPGPYVITVDPLKTPGVDKIPDIGHKQPWGVNQITLVNQQETIATFSTGPRAKLSASGLRGRELWMNSCMNCHAGPEGAPAGTKAARPFPVLVAHASYNADYFKRYVRDPKSVNPAATMPGKPHYTDEDLAGLIAYLSAGTP